MTKITLEDVAKKTGVSIKTVSRVLNNEPNVSDKTLHLVQEAIKDLNYVPNLAARNLSCGKAKAIGLVLGWPINSAYSSSLIDYSLVACEKYQQSLVLFSKADDISSKVIRSYQGKQIDGVILDKNAAEDPEIILNLRDRNIPRVIINSDKNVNHPDAAFIRIDDRKAAYEAVQYLIELGHHEIGYIGNFTKTEHSRLTGYRQALKDAGLSDLEDRISIGNGNGFEIGISGMDRMFSRGTHMTAVFAITDDIAMGAINSIWMHGFKVPEDISVVGFDDVYYSSLMIPLLTTVHQPIDEIAEMAVKKLTERINQKSSELEEIVLPTYLVKRGTCRSIN